MTVQQANQSESLSKKTEFKSQNKESQNLVKQSNEQTK